MVCFLPPTVAPIRATPSSNGMLKKELSVSHVSARASRGTMSIKVFARTTAFVKLNDATLCTNEFQ